MERPKNVQHITVLQGVSITPRSPRPLWTGLVDQHGVALGSHPQAVGFGKVFRGVGWWLMACGYVAVLYGVACRVNAVLATVDSKYDVAGTIGGAFMCLTVPLATYQIVMHLTNFIEPRQQSNTVRIIFMLHVYSVCAFLSLRYTRWSLFMACVRELYEAYVIYCFLHYLMCYLGEEQRLQTRLAHKPSAVGHHRPPFCCLPPWQMEREFLQRCKQGVFQYVFIRIISTVVALWLQVRHLYTEGDFDPKRGYFWITVVTCISQSWALYVLVLFYNATHKDLYHIHAMGKFLSIKAVVFFSWWQGILIELLEHHGHIAGVGRHPAEHVAQGIQDLLICLEMFLAAIVFLYAFPLSDYIREAGKAGSSGGRGVRSGSRSGEEEEEETAGGAVGSSGSGAGSPGEGTPMLVPTTVAARKAGARLSLSPQPQMSFSKSHPRLDRLWDPMDGRGGLPSYHQPTSIWFAVRASVMPLELQEDLRETAAKLQTKIHDLCSWARRRRERARLGSKLEKLADGHRSSVMMTL